MRAALAIVALALPACTAARRTTIHPDGSVVLENGGQLGGSYTIAYTRTPRGGVKFAEDINNEKSFSDATLAAVSAVGLVQTGLSNRANTASDTAIATGAQKADVAKAAQAAAVETQRIKSAEVIAGIPKP